MTKTVKDLHKELEDKLNAGDDMMGALRKAPPVVRGYYRKWLEECKELMKQIKEASK